MIVPSHDTFPSFFCLFCKGGMKDAVTPHHFGLASISLLYFRITLIIAIFTCASRVSPEERQPSKPDATVAKRCGCSIKNNSVNHE